MREIKFRAWDGKNMWTHGDNLMYGIVTNIFLFEQFDELMQYTGLKDKNGKDIYEGDKVKTNEPKEGSINEIVIFENGCFKVKAMGQKKINCPIGSINKKYIEIIGNIHENKVG